MAITEKMYKLKGKVLHYAWGGYHFIPDLLGLPNKEKLPFAEYWLGAHHLATSVLMTQEGEISLYDLIQQDPVTILSEKVFTQFGDLPYLCKVQDVREILSIQVHPSKAEAEAGYIREEAEGIPIHAPNRNYKDKNHKPEMMLALSEFWLLHGFKQKKEIELMLEQVPEFNVFISYFKRVGLKALYQLVMEMNQIEINALLFTLIKREVRKKNDGELTKEMPGWWVARLYEGKEIIGDIDRAIFSIYLFNIVKVNPGEGVFQGAGVPHAYLEGQTMELMANSDNVLRAGLTPKHIDVPELLKHTIFEGIMPTIMKGIEGMWGEKVYTCPVNEFGMAKIELSSNLSYSNKANSVEIFMVTEGGALFNNSLVLKRGESAVVLAGCEYSIQSSGDCRLFKAFVPSL